MRWRSGRRSSNIEDRRGTSARVGFPGGLRFPTGRRRVRVGRRGGVGGLGLIIIVVAALYFGIDPSVLFQSVSTTQAPPPPRGEAVRESAAEAELRDFVAVVLADTEDTWHALFESMDGRYVEPKLVLFTDAVRSACGFAQAAVGPFYCPSDRKLYIDLGFYDDLKNRFRAPGDFAQAYVIAHEVGHHVQTLLGVSEQVSAAQRRVSRADANALSVRQELQADCFAGLWAHHAQRTRQILESGDIEEGLNAAAAIGDDRLQRQTQGHVVPDSFTHGSSAQRVRWFQRGLEEGELAACDTFAVDEL